MNKILWIDVMKGLGILTVVAGHIYEGEISRTLYIFHMPLFFFISGYLFRPTLEYKKLFAKKTVQLLIPYFSFLILLDSKTISGLLYNFLTNSMNYDKWLFYKEHFSSMIYGGQELQGYLVVFWFVTCLFLTQQLFNYLFNKLNPKIFLMLILSLLAMSYTNTYIYPETSIPWNANVILHSLPIFYIGFISRKKTLKMNNTLLATLGVVVILFSFYYPENVYDMKYATYGIPIITLVSSLILILNLKYISIKLSNYEFSYLVFSEIGKASMIVMYLHPLIQILVKSYFSADNTIRFLAATIISYLIYFLLSKFKFGKAFFLGSYKDLKEITQYS